MTVMRTQYRDLITGTVRDGATGHGESLIDLESYLEPLEQARNASLVSFGVASGLSVQATTGQPGVRVAVGVAVDAGGRLVVLAPNGSAVVDPDVDPNEVRNIPMVPVPAAGLVLDTVGMAGDRYLTLRWREVESEAVANAPVLVHAPWVRLVPVAGFSDVGEQVILARVVVDAQGLVTELSAEGRRLVGVVGGRVELRVPELAGGAGAGELRARPDGGLEVALGVGAGARPALAIDPAGNLGVGTAPLARLHVRDAGGLGPEDPDGVLTGSKVPLLVQSDSTALGALNADGRAVFALDIDSNSHTNTERGVVSLCDFFDGQRHAAITLKGGRVGIGTADATERLTVDGGALVTGGARVNGVAVGTKVAAIDYDLEHETVGVGDPRFNLRLQSPNNIVFHTGGDRPRQRMLLDPAGKLKVGAGNPDDPLDVAGDVRVCSDKNPIRLTGKWTDFPASGRDRAEISNDTDGFRTLMIVGNRSASPNVRKVSVWDRLEVHGPSCAESFCNLSDARLKTDLDELADPLEAVSRLRAVSFRWREGAVEGAGGPIAGELAGAGSIGVLAQEVAEVYPELVTTMGASEHLAVNYQGLTAVLLEAVKELKAENERLRGRVDALELGRSSSSGAG